jgi:Flp pilus assembly protein TadG
MVEFAIALPVLLMMLLGIIEVGRMIFMYTLVTNASRDAVRFASAYGRSDDGYLKYKYCSGIRTAAKQSAYIVPLANANIAINYDSGPSTGLKYANGCNNDAPNATGEDSRVTVINSGDRVVVTVQATYTRLVNLLPIPTRTFTSTSARTILGVYNLPNP